MRRQDIVEIVRRDRRYAYEAYEFILGVFEHMQQLTGRKPKENEKPGDERHLSGAEILAGTVELARREFGFLAKTVFHQWGISQTDDVGEMVFNLIDASLISKTDSDRPGDFQNLFDLDRALSEDFAIPLSEAPAVRRGHR